MTALFTLIQVILNLSYDFKSDDKFHQELMCPQFPKISEIEVERPFEYQSEKYKTDGKTGEDVGATAIDLFLLKRAIFGKTQIIQIMLPSASMAKNIYLRKMSN